VNATKVWIAGEVHDAATATVPALDHGLTVGDGVFETLKVLDGTPFALRRHLTRLRRSAVVLDLALPLGDDELRAAAAQVVDAVVAAGAEPRRLRITVTGGPGPLGSGREHAVPTVLLAAAPAPPWPATTEVITGPWARNEHSAVAGAKTTSYAENVVALAAAHRRGASEAILANTAGGLCEGTGSNLFLVHDGRLCTPSLATGCLAGITRELVLELVDAHERNDLTLADLGRADEAFLTSSTRDVHPITAVDGVALPGPAPGPRTRAAADALADLQARTLDP
jgi:branched-chain amino acid aminotransferase